jgi:hypothetical protein
MSQIKLSEKELQQLKDLQIKTNELIFTLGQIESQKISIIPQLEKLKKDRENLGEEFQNKYGNGNINLETGEFTKSE